MEECWDLIQAQFKMHIVCQLPLSWTIGMLSLRQHWGQRVSRPNWWHLSLSLSLSWNGFYTWSHPKFTLQSIFNLYHQWPTPEPLCSTYSHHDINITQTKLGVKRDFGLLQFFSFCLDKKSVFVKIAISMTRPHLHLWHQKSHIFDNLLMRNIVE